ncbi:MAG TPA: 1,2-phenylacetyl-CoA epoxidase subunit PaaD [Myxococcaceae bacterium]
MTPSAPTASEVWAALDGVNDPELPVVSIVQLGMIRDVRVEGLRCTIVFSPTFIGCPATRLISGAIEGAVRGMGLEPEVHLSYAQPWSPGQISPKGCAALRAAHISIGREPGPVEGNTGGLEALAKARVPCPHCGSEDTELVTAFGATRCRAVRRCLPCRNLFEQLKPT